MTNVAICPNCENSFEFSRSDISIKLTINIEEKKYRVYHYKKRCPSCSESLFMKIGMADENNGKWLISKEQEK